MNKFIETKISDFSGGISDDIREISATKFSVAKHFNTYKDPKKLIPYRSVEDESPASGNAIGNFLYSSTGYLMGLGKVVGQTYPSLWYKTGASLITDAWLNDKAYWTGAAGTVLYPLFIEFGCSDGNSYIYFAEVVSTTYYLVRAVANPLTAQMDEDWKTLSGAPTAQGFAHYKSNILFIPCSNKIDKIISDGTFSANVAPSISSNLEITSLTEYGSYLAIACRDKTGGNSKVILWDMVSTTTFIDVIDWGRDDLYVLNNLEGYLVGVSATNTGTVFSGDNAKLSVSMWGGGKPSLVKEIYARKLGTSSPTITLYSRINFIKDNRLYFSAAINNAFTDGSEVIGLFTFGRKNSSYPLAINFDRFATNDNSETSVIAAIAIQDYFWTVHTAVGTVTRTDDQANFVATSIYESQKFATGDASLVKNLVGASVTHDKLAATDTVALKYRKDGATTWTTLITSSTDDTLFADAIGNVGDYHEIEFRIESYHGANVTGFSFQEEIIGKKKYGI